MNEIIQQVLSDIESIKSSLEILSTDGMPIIDTFAPITFMTTMFATAFGGWITLQLFKRQEKMRIREDLRLDFFYQYKNKHFKLLEDLTELKNKIDFIALKEKKNVNLVYIRKPIIIDGQKATWILSMHTEEQYKNAKLACLVYEQALDITRFIDYNQNIYCKAINRHEDAFINIIDTHLILDTMDKSLQTIEIDDIDNSMIDFKIESMEEYNENIRLLMKQGDVLDESRNSFIKLYEEIENEFIGKYFKPKWYQWKKKKEYKNNVN